MAADDVRTRLRGRLTEEYGMDEADLLLDRPPGGWDDLATKEWLHLEFAAFRAGMDARFAGVDAQFAAVDGQFAGIGPRLTSLEQGVAKLDSRLDTIDSRLDKIDSEMRSQTWRLVAVLMTGMSIAIAAASAITIVR